MPIEATVYRAVLAIPDDVDATRTIAKDVLLEWNSITGRKQDIHLEPVSAGHIDLTRPDLIEEIDIVLGTFWTTVDDTTTGGTSLAEAVRRLTVDENVPSMIGFSERSIPTDRLDPNKYEKLQEFREDCRETGYFTFSNSEEYEVQLKHALARTMDRILSSSGVSDSSDHDGPSEYNVEVDHERLKLSEEIHREQDEQNIERIVEHFQENSIEQPYRVLDAGCGYGTVTQSRFGDDDRFEVLAIDDTRDVLKIAKDRYAAPNIEYRWLDVSNLDKAALGIFDLVFASYLFHHVANQESVLDILWAHVREGGALAVRSCEDGQHLHYPPNEDMDWIVDITDSIPGSSDRTHGRRLPTHLKRLSPTPDDMWLDLQNYHTVGLNRSERRDYWDVFHSNRLHYAEVRAEREAATSEDKRLYETMSDRMSELKDKIETNEHVFDAKSVPVAVAMK